MKVMEISRDLTAAFAGLLLAELGAEVIKVEEPEPDPGRDRTGGMPDDSMFVYANRRKKSVTLDLTLAPARQAFLRLAAEVDALVEDLGPGGLESAGIPYETLRAANPNIVVVSCSPFGSTGPRAGWQGSDLVVQAMGGIVHNTGWDGDPPLQLAGHAASCVAGINAATALLAATFGVEAGLEPGVHIDLSMQETFAPHWSRHIAQWCYSGTGTRREKREFGRQGFPHTVMAKDDWLYILALNAEWEPLAFFLGLEPFVTHEFTDPRVRVQRWPEIERHFYESVRSKGRYQWFEEAAARGYTFAPIDDPKSILASPQMASRGFFGTADVDGAQVPCPGLPFAFDAGILAPNRAPGPGEHTLEVLRETAGLTRLEIEGLASDAAGRPA